MPTPSQEMNFHDGNITENFRKWRQMLELTFAGPLANKSDTEKCSYLLLYIGQHGRDIYNSWVLTDDEKKRPKIILDKFEEYCNPRTNITMDRHIFFLEINIRVKQLIIMLQTYDC